jgi:hypothetical protein
MTIYLLRAPVTFYVAPSLAYKFFFFSFPILREDVIGHNIAPERISGTALLERPVINSRFRSLRVGH